MHKFLRVPENLTALLVFAPVPDSTTSLIKSTPNCGPKSHCAYNKVEAARVGEGY